MTAAARSHEQQKQDVLTAFAQKVGIVCGAMLAFSALCALLYSWVASFASTRFEVAIEPFVQRLEAGERRDSLIVNRLESIGDTAVRNSARMVLIGEALHYEIGTPQRARALKRLDSLNGATADH